MTAPDRAASVAVPWNLAVLFDLGWVLGRVGHDPCDEWDIDNVLNLPDGLNYVEGRVTLQCRRCGAVMEFNGDNISDFEMDDPNNLCGGSPRCLP